MTEKERLVREDMARARAALHRINPPIIQGVDLANGESWTVWGRFNDQFADARREAADWLAPGEVHEATALTLEKGLDGVWSRRRV